MLRSSIKFECDLWQSKSLMFLTLKPMVGRTKPTDPLQALCWMPATNLWVKRVFKGHDNFVPVEVNTSTVLSLIWMNPFPSAASVLQFSTRYRREKDVVEVTLNQTIVVISPNCHSWH